ncbi:MAG TPA: hypothetical protein VGC41_16400, partial [Kofleriaceae bacterium]
MKLVALLLFIPALAFAQVPAPSPAAPPVPTAPQIDHPVEGTNRGTQQVIAHEGEHAENKTASSSFVAIKVIGGLVALLVLAYLGGNRRVVKFQEQLGIHGVITAGFPFVALGVIAS